MTSDRPVSAHVLAEARLELRRYGLVIWLDREGHFTPLVDRLAGSDSEAQLGAPVRALRGSHLALLRSLDGLQDGLDPTPLLVHVPGHNEQSLRATPLLELYHAGKRWRKALETAVTEAAAGRVPAEDLQAFLAKSTPLTLDTADAWLAGLLRGRRDGASDLAEALDGVGLNALVDDLLSGGLVAQRVDAAKGGPDALAVRQALAVRTGMPATFWDHVHATDHADAATLAFAALSWALCVEFVHDLRRAPFTPLLTPAVGLPAPVIGACRALARHVCDHRPDLYRRTADETEGSLQIERTQGTAEDLGKVDTFRFEEDRILSAALRCLGEARWGQVAEWAGARVAGDSVWLRDDPGRRAAWQLVGAAASLGLALTTAGPRLGEPGQTASLTSLEAAVEAYTARGAAVDLAHRRLEQRRAALLFPQLPHYEALRTHLDALRGLWRTWADGWATDFNALCRRVGFLPDIALQQRTLFDDVVRGLISDEARTAIFVIDAFRYEMADELRATLSGLSATHVQLRARLAELPTVTEIGMNALAPTAQGGRLRPVMRDGRVQALRAGEFQVARPDDRRRAMHERVGGATCPLLPLSEVIARDADALRRSIAQARLVVVHSTEIDEAGENGMGVAVFDLVMQRLHAAWTLLREAGVRRFVFTADHGFLLLDPTAHTVQCRGRKVDTKRRHLLTTIAADHADEVRVPFSALGYEDQPDWHVVVPETTAVFDTNGGPGNFVHGGNSLQERVIPVLVVTHRIAVGSDVQRYAVRVEARTGVAGMHCVAVCVSPVAQEALAFSRASELALALRAVDPDGVAVELCDTRNGARIEGGTIRAPIDREFEVFFKLSGSGEARARIEVHAPGGSGVQAGHVETRFAVSVTTSVRNPATGTAPAASRAWLEQLPAGGVRALFEHMHDHGRVSEGDATMLLGGAGALRRFSLKFEEYAALIPFECRIDSVGGTKWYIRCQ